MNENSYDVVIAGAGAAGLMAGIFAAQTGVRTAVFEKNSKFGVKILMSGGTRCNITQDTDWRGIATKFAGAQGRFLKFSLASFTPTDVRTWFAKEGVDSLVESTGKVFPESNRAIDVRDALVSAARAAGAELFNNSPIEGFFRRESGFAVRLPDREVTARTLIVTTGGQSFPGCGTTGEGYPWLTALSHHVVLPRPALVPVRVEDSWAKELSGVTIPDVRVHLRFGSPEGRQECKEDVRDEDRGSFLFTHKGCSGPVVLNVSRGVTDPARNLPKFLSCDWLPDLGEDAIRESLLAANASDRQVVTELANWLPKRLAGQLCASAGFAESTPLAGLGRKRANALIRQIKHCSLSIDGTLGFAKAEVTAGGIALDEVNPLTMESRIVPGLFLAGEILDIDGPVGGYNFQAAWSTGRLAGISAATSLKPVSPVVSA
jgi:predicted Rossmann fold flavoprotein